MATSVPRSSSMTTSTGCSSPVRRAPARRSPRAAGLKKQLLELGGDGPADRACRRRCRRCGGRCSARLLLPRGPGLHFGGAHSRPRRRPRPVRRKAEGRRPASCGSVTRRRGEDMGPLCNEGTLEPGWSSRSRTPVTRCRGGPVRRAGRHVLPADHPDRRDARHDDREARDVRTGSADHQGLLPTRRCRSPTAPSSRSRPRYTPMTSRGLSRRRGARTRERQHQRDTNYWDQLAPFGGARKSGNGRELSQWFLRCLHRAEAVEHRPQ